MAKNMYTVRNGKLWVDATELKLRGINWFGAETDARCVHALWEESLDTHVNVLKEGGFNAVRLTMSAEAMLGLDSLSVTTVNSSKNPGLDKLTVGGLMDIVVRKLAEAGILVMFNMHRMKPNEDISELWYTEEYPETRVIDAWVRLTTRYKDAPNVFAMDIKNEPHGRSAWGGNDRTVDWAAACERIGNRILQANPRLLICAAGVTMDIWGDDVDGARTRPVRLSVPNKVFYSPHFYKHWRYPNKEGHAFEPYMDRCMGRLAKAGGAVVVGEYGYDHKDELDTQWIRDFQHYCIRNNIENVFYWCLNENGAFNHTILEKDWKTIMTDKIRIIQAITPRPTKLVFPKGSVVIQRPPTPQPTRPTSSPPPVTPTPVIKLLSSTPPQPSSLNTDIDIQILQKNTWKQGMDTIFQQEVIVSNKSKTKTFSNVVLDVLDTTVHSHYSAIRNGTALSFPDWMLQNKLPPGGTWTFGFQAVNKKGNVVVRSSTHI